MRLLAAVTLVCLYPAISYSAPNSEIGIAKNVTSGPILVPDGTIALQYTIYVSNPNNFDVENVQVVDDLSVIFTSPASIVSASVSSADFSVDHTGLADTTLLDGTDTLAAGGSGTIIIDVVVAPSGATGPFNNSADLSGGTICETGTGTTSGLYQERWDVAGANTPSLTVPLSTNFNDGLDAFGFRQETSAPNTTGNSTGDGAQIFETGSTTNGREILQGGGWVSAPCAATGSTWELRFRMGRSVATYLGALKTDAVPTSADIITGGSGIDGFQQTLSLFQSNITSYSAIFNGTLGLPIGVKMQIDDEGAAFTLALEERINGGAWAEVPTSRIWEDKPTGAEIGGRLVTDTSDNGLNANPASTNGSGTTDDPTPVTLPTFSPSLQLVKSANGATDVEVGDTINYTYTVNNDGDVVLYNISVSDSHNASDPAPTPSAETLLTDSAPTGDSVDATIDNVWDELWPGDTITFSDNYIVTQSDVDTLQ